MRLALTPFLAHLCASYLFSSSTPPLARRVGPSSAGSRSHFHEHAVVSGSSTLRYSSTHRVADTDGNTFGHVQKRCEEVLAGGSGGAAAEPRGVLDLFQVRNVGQFFP